MFIYVLINVEWVEKCPMPKVLADDYTVTQGTFLHENLVFQITNCVSWLFAY
jgi:hypothetical protein